MSTLSELFVPAAPEVREVCLAKHHETSALIVIKQETAWRWLERQGVQWEIGALFDAPLVITRAALQRLAHRCTGMGEVVYAVGGGRAADAAKYVAHVLGLPWVCVPSALSCLAFFTAHVELWTLSGWEHEEATPAAALLLDWALIGSAPPLYRAAGVVDVLSMITACETWRRDAEPHAPYVPEVAALARAIADMVIACAPQAHEGEVSALRTLAMALALTAQLERWLGHARVRIGEEHALAWRAYTLAAGATWRGEPAPVPFTYAHLLAAGILEAAQQQGQDLAALRDALRAWRP